MFGLKVVLNSWRTNYPWNSDFPVVKYLTDRLQVRTRLIIKPLWRWRGVEGK